MEAQIEFKKWLDAEIDRVKGFANSEILSFEERLEYFNQSSALMNAKIKLQELELEETNQTIDGIIEQGKQSAAEKIEALGGKIILPLCEEIKHQSKEKANGL